MLRKMSFLITACMVLLLSVSCNAIQYNGIVSQSLDSAVSEAVLSQLGDFYLGEKTTQGHIILSVEERGEKTIVYVVASYASFGFENDVFTIVSGCGAIPAVIEFIQKGSQYEMLSYTEPADGEDNYESKKELFPSNLLSKVLYTDKYYPELQGQQEKQAEDYVKSIGRDAVVDCDYVEKNDFNISVEASNYLFCLDELYDYPFWIGTQETVENGIRYIYEGTEEDYTGYSILTFTKKSEGGITVQQLKYKVTGSTVEKL